MKKEDFVAQYPVPDKRYNQSAILDWSEVQTKLDFVFPDEFCFIIETYGTISIDNFITLFNPFSVNKAINSDAINFYKTSYKSLKDLFPETYTRAEDSFVTWAATDNGDTLFWDTKGHENQNDWNVGIHDKSQAEEEVYPMTTLDFLHNLASGKIKSSILPQDFLEGVKTLQPVASPL